ncbi:phospholipase A1 VesT1.02-like [Teleopsis dalmanni]|uniref:phospholipase A1 VesT1.02-like n=1 Tax=Teleopsis dalmanni TaxID=139649 RepID=UPI0018CE080D|nr:phospholipase A1 VesT1.02-like [Teleopsis dalmanni]
MKVISVVLLCIAAASAIPVQEQTNGWSVPQEDGTFEWMTTEEFEALKDSTPQGRAAAVVTFYLYTNSNPNSPQEIAINDASALKNSNYNSANPTRFIIHGWQNNYLSDVNVVLRGALLATGKYNVICVDWSSKAETINYAASVLRVPGVGKQVANFIDFLYTSGGMSFGNLLVMGHSLGAHVSGFAGKNVKYGRIHQITGLDPALPLYSYDDPSERLNQNDADYVESIQTCGGLLGFLQPIGKSAFYPNGGRTQPGCGLDLAGSCAHSRSYEYYGEAIRDNDFPTMKCGNYEAAVDKSCGSTYSSVRMGAPSNYVNAFGDFYVPVNSKSPYGKGS